jgi:hypothetical protein
VKVRARPAIAVALAAAGGLGLAVAAGAHDSQGMTGAPTGTGTGTVTSGTATTVTGGGGTGSTGTPIGELTHPRVWPIAGTADTVFHLSFRLRETPGHTGFLETDYRVVVSPHRGAANSCWPSQPRAITSGQKGQRLRIPLRPPSSGWCRGTYRVTVYLERGPYCPPPQNGTTTPCPEFATQEMDTGRVRFTVG